MEQNIADIIKQIFHLLHLLYKKLRPKPKTK